MYSYRNKIYHHSVICEIPWQIQKRKDTYIQVSQNWRIRFEGHIP
jgi:hypothetical protein